MMLVLITPILKKVILKKFIGEEQNLDYPFLIFTFN